MLLSGSVKIDYGTNDYTSLESFQSATGKGQGSALAILIPPGSLLINSDSPAVNAGYATANGQPHPVFALFESTYPGHGSIAATPGALFDRVPEPCGTSVPLNTGIHNEPPPAAPTNVRIVR